MNMECREWPPRSPNLCPLDFCLWGYLKSKVYSPRPATLNELQANIVREVAQIDPAMTMRAMLDMRERAVKSIAAGGRPLSVPFLFCTSTMWEPPVELGEKYKFT